MPMKRWTLLSLVAGFILIAIAGWAWLFFNTGCAALTLERVDPQRPVPTDEGQPFMLNETKVRSEAPNFAALLDQAKTDGRATEPHEREARAMAAYIQSEAHGAPILQWQGIAVRAHLAIC